LEIQKHIATGGRISLTTDAWSANNGTDHAAVTGHWIDEKWNQRSHILDVIHLKEPIHSGEYLAEQLLAVTDDYQIRHAVFTVTRDNASNNTAMLEQYEIGACSTPATLQQPWAFTVKEGDVRCMAHIINLAVQEALKTLKATPSNSPDVYRVEEGKAHSRGLTFSEKETVIDTLTKLRKHIYVFRNRRLWREALHIQASAMEITPIKLSLDMPVRWNSTYYMLTHALDMEPAIVAICASQQMDPSMREIIITASEWQILRSLELFFKIFKEAAEQVQGDNYPTLNYCIPYYLRLMDKLKKMRDSTGYKSPIGEACFAAYEKLNQYYSLATNQRHSHSTIATICDPRFNFDVFDRYLSDGDTRPKDRALAQWRACYNKYKARETDIHVAKVMARIEAETEASTQDTKDPKSDDEMYTRRGPKVLEFEWQWWFSEEGYDRNGDILKFWAAKQFEYPIIACMARDHLAIPASSAASERIFSIGGDIITKKRNRLTPSTVRYLLCLRDWGIVHDEEGEE
jgi:hypothetical protein